MNTPQDLILKIQKAVSEKKMTHALNFLKQFIFTSYKIPDLVKLNRFLDESKYLWTNLLDLKLQKIAILGDYTTQPIKELIKSLFLSELIWIDIYEATYRSIDTEILDKTSGLYRFKPDVVMIVTNHNSIRNYPDAFADENKIKLLLETELERFKNYWRTLKNSLNPKIIQHNFDLPPVNVLGNLEETVLWSKKNYIRALNDHFLKLNGNEIHLLDVHAVCINVGRENWFSPKWYYHSKHGFDPTKISNYGRQLGGLIRAIYGKNKKCLVIDLDNTLWGGIIGDDGVDGILLGSSSPEGEAYLEFGKYLKALKDKGIILAINSKNDIKNVDEVFEKHAELPLRKIDFSAICCNWERKSENLKVISKKLNIHLDSLIFIDDNPAEVEEVRYAVPETTTILLDGDPANFSQHIASLELFNSLHNTEEDLSRIKSYEILQEIHNNGDSLEGYLESLNMQAIIRPAENKDVKRIEQLFLKTNQFNFNGRKYSAEEINRSFESEDEDFYVVELKDNFLSYGIVSALAFSKTREGLKIGNWVMSCRVFNRQLEEVILEKIAEIAKRDSKLFIFGEFQETNRNGYTKEALNRLGFKDDEILKGMQVFNVSDFRMETKIKTVNHFAP